MAATDRSWTIAPALGWFAVFVVAGLVVVDGNLDALGDRLTVTRTTPGPSAGPAITAPATQVAEADADDDTQQSGAPAVPPALPALPGSHDVGDLTDACLAPGPPAPGADPTACKQWAMDGFYHAVAESKAGKLGRPVRVSWYGDSVIATDAIPGRLRTRLQSELGDGGPGFVFVTPPHRFCGHEAITRSASGTWFTHAISTMQTADGLYGPGGSTAESDGARATIKLVAGKVSALELYYLAQPHGGTATVTADGADVMAVDTGGDAKQAGWQAAQVPAGAAKIEIATEHRTRLFGIDLENASGAVVDNLGVVSVNVKSFANNDPAHWSAELAHRDADLVMIMIGANEAQWLGPKDADTKAYQGHYEQVLAIVRRARPDATCLVVSPTDQAEAKDGEYPSRPVMPVLVDAQRRAAAAQGCAFFSTYTWMGGRGSAAKWFAKGYVGTDFQHLSTRGANKLADAVYDALMTGFQRYGGSPRP